MASLFQLCILSTQVEADSLWSLPTTSQQSSLKLDEQLIKILRLDTHRLLLCPRHLSLKCAGWQANKLDRTESSFQK